VKQAAVSYQPSAFSEAPALMRDQGDCDRSPVADERRSNTQMNCSCLIGVHLRSSATRFAFFVTQSTRGWVETRPVRELSLES
jgi:hypothetical protein